MTSPREQAIEAAAQIVASRVTFVGPVCSLHRDVAREIIDAYLAARARLDGAKMMPRNPERDVIRKGCQSVSMLTHTGAEVCYRAMHDATPKDGER